MSVFSRDLGDGVGQGVCDVCGWRSAPAASAVARDWTKAHRRRCPVARSIDDEGSLSATG
jgi:hypothetical protein